VYWQSQPSEKLAAYLDNRAEIGVGIQAFEVEADYATRYRSS